MEKRARSPYLPPPLQDERRLRRVAPVVVKPEELELLLSKDKCYQDLKKKEAELTEMELPTEEQIAELWEEALVAYWNWIHAHMREAEVKARLKLLHGKMAIRSAEVMKVATAQKIHAIRQKLGRRFMPHLSETHGLNNLPPLPAVRYPRKDAQPSATTTTPAPSSSQTETTSSPPPPSGAP